MLTASLNVEAGSFKDDKKEIPKASIKLLSLTHPTIKQ